MVRRKTLPVLPEMLNASSAEKDAEDKFSHISDMDYKKVDSYFVSYSSDGHKADEIVVIAVKDKADVDEAKESLTKQSLLSQAIMMMCGKRLKIP